MARYRIVHWKDVPSLVEAAEGDCTARHELSQKFQDLIDALAMREGATEGDAYLEGWGQGAWLERAGSPDPIYARWIATYAADEFGDVVRAVLAATDTVAERLRPAERVTSRTRF